MMIQTKMFFYVRTATVEIKHLLIATVIHFRTKRHTQRRYESRAQVCKKCNTIFIISFGQTLCRQHFILKPYSLITYSYEREQQTFAYLIPTTLLSIPAFITKKR